MSPRAAWRLEGMGFDLVYHYVAGIADWAAAGLPIEGRASKVPTAGDSATRETALCGPGDPIGEAADAAVSAGEDSCLVVNEHSIVVGRLYYKDLEGARNRKVEDVMDPGPSTFRPNVPVTEIAEVLCLVWQSRTFQVFLPGGPKPGLIVGGGLYYYRTDVRSVEDGD
ncbi:MAG: hypothetical protein ACRDIA_07470 [Actinomycetota bacterium]